MNSLRATDLPPITHEIAGFFAERGGAAYLVGGFVRDLLLGRPTADIDITTSASVGESGTALARVLDGTFVMLDAGRSIGRVAYQGGGETRHIDITPLGGSIEENLRRRDFSIDAMAARLQPSERRLPVIDPFGGETDLAGRRIRAFNEDAFKDDPCRLLRAPRLSAQLDMSIDRETEALVRRDARLVRRVAGERVRDELLKLLDTPRATPALKLLDGLGLLCEIMPEFLDARGVEQPPEHHWDVFRHCVETPGQVDRVLSAGHGAADEVVDAVPTFPGMTEHFAERVSDGHPRRALLKLAGLLHDVAKPATKTVEETGRIRFLGHHVVGAEVAGEVTSRLRLSGRGSGMVTEMVRHHLRPSQMSQPGEMPTPRAVYRYFRDVGDTAIDTVYLNMADYLAAKGPDIDVQDWRRHCGIMKTIIELGLASPMNEKAPRLVDGRVLMERFGLQPGPRLGKLLELVDEARATGEIVSADDALELVRAELEAGNGVA